MEDFLLFLVLDELLYEDETRPKKKRRCLDDNEYRAIYSRSNLTNELRITAPDDFKNSLRMDSETYNELLRKVRPFIEKKDTIMRDAITANERLSVTLRFLASGQSFENLKFITAISSQSIGLIIIETCRAIIKVLKEYIRIPKTEKEWETVAEEFGTRWNFPNCIGAIDGKHIEIKKPANTGSYFNYKKKFSIILLAIVDANYEFLMAEADANGWVSSGGVLSNSSFYDQFENNKLKIPVSGRLHEDFPEQMPFVFVGGDAFPLQKNFMKPYAGDNLSNDETIFNYRLSMIRRIAENAFGVLSSRFRVLSTTINLSPEKATIITLTTCYLHNFLRRNNSSVYLRGSVDVGNTDAGEIQSASWRTDPRQLTKLEPTLSKNPTSISKEIRQKFTNYFNGVGAVFE